MKLSANSLVFTKEGYKKVENLTHTDEILSDGKYINVTKKKIMQERLLRLSCSFMPLFYLHSDCQILALSLDEKKEKEFEKECQIFAFKNSLIDYTHTDGANAVTEFVPIAEIKKHFVLKIKLSWYFLFTPYIATTKNLRNTKGLDLSLEGDELNKKVLSLIGENHTEFPLKTIVHKDLQTLMNYQQLIAKAFGDIASVYKHPKNDLYELRVYFINKSLRIAKLNNKITLPLSRITEKKEKYHDIYEVDTKGEPICVYGFLVK